MKAKSTKELFLELLSSKEATAKMGLSRQNIDTYKVRLREGRLTERTMQKWVEKAKGNPKVAL